MRRLLLVAIAALLASCTPSQEAERIIDAITIECQEDMPCWNCRTMGNRVCGPGHERGGPR